MAHTANPFGRYILSGRRVIPCPDRDLWNAWLEQNDRQVARTDVGERLVVSTIFLGLAYRRPECQPALFETRLIHVDDVDYGGDSICSSTWEAAEAAHQAMVEQMLSSQPSTASSSASGT